jgi:uncharacterized membrane protein
MNTEREGFIFSKGRLESLTDGVFAVIMTILVFNVSGPELILAAEGEYATERLSSRLLDLWPDIIAYIVSFATLGVYWVAHHRIFRWIVNIDRPLIWMNISFLVTIGLIPFSTVLLAEYRDQQISIFIYSSNAILAGVILHFVYHYAKGHLELVDKTEDKTNRSAATTKTERIAIAGRPVSEVEKYADLKQQGIITEEEFQRFQSTL